ncbi:MAG TPA: serine hydrolase [Gammaproteobacteria bacterium]
MVRLLLALGLLCWDSAATAGARAEIPLTEATPQSQGLDGARLQQAVDGIAAGDYGRIDALLVLRNDFIVLERYFSPLYRGPDYRYPVRSVTKSITSALVGIARGQGKLPALQTGLRELFPQYSSIANLDTRKRAVTFEHLLSMTAGFAWDELSPGAMSDSAMVSSPDWIKHVLDLPMHDLPGERLVYNSGCSMLLSDILLRGTGMAVDEFAARYLFEPIGIDNWRWSLGKNNVINTAYGLSMTRRDMARFGTLYLNRGNWRGRQVVPEDWVGLSTATRVLGSGENYPYAYAYQWWRLQDGEPTAAMLATNDLYTALGMGGQFITVIPHLDMVVVSTAENYAPANEELLLKLLRDHIIPAVSR